MRDLGGILFGLGLGVLALGAGCAFDDSTLQRCDPDGACAEGYVCEPSFGFCVKRDEVVVPPGPCERCSEGVVCCNDVCCGDGEVCCGDQCVEEAQCCLSEVCEGTEICCDGRLCVEADACCLDVESNVEVAVDLLHDRNNCGVCGVRCNEKEHCVTGACVCRSPWDTCGDDERCGTDISGDRDHCGACDRSCGEGGSCVNSSCACGPNFLMCPGAASVCVDALNDPDHCGACGNACVDRCVGGVCRCGDVVCSGGQGCCASGGGLSCTDLDSVVNCGGCGVRCGVGEACVDGACRCNGLPACGEGLECCARDGQVACRAANDCNCGDGSFSCTGGQICCGVTCVDVMSDGDHCGSCGRRCEGEQVCLGGACGCSAGVACTDDGVIRCVDTSNSVTHCGGCGLNCAQHPNVASAECVSGTCRYACQPGFGDCLRTPDQPGCETVLATNVTHCGGCGQTCSSQNATHVQCAGGICSGTCSPGWGNCDNDWGTGCETPLTSLANCGACGQSCPAYPHAQSVCDGGQCSMVCNPGRIDCNNDPADGCEATTCRTLNNLLLLYNLAHDGSNSSNNRAPAATALANSTLIVKPVTHPNLQDWAWLNPGGHTIRRDGLVSKQPVVRFNTAATDAALVTALKAGTGFSVEVWVQAEEENPPNKPARIVAITESNDRSKQSFFLGQNNVGHGEVRLRVGADNATEVTADGLFPLNTKVHVVVTYDGTWVRIYKDGDLFKSESRSGSLSGWSTAHKFSLFNSPEGGFLWLGRLYLVAIYGDVLTATEVRTNFERGHDPL